MADDDELGFFSVRPKVLILIGAVIGSVLTVALVAARFALPRWFPEFVVAESPWIGPAFDAAVLHDRAGDFRDRLDDWGAAVVPAMCSALGSRDPKRRKLAADILGGCQDSRSVLPLIEALDDSDADVLLAVIKALGNSKDVRASAPLIAAMPGLDPQRQQGAAMEAIRRIAHPDLVKQLTTTLLVSSQPMQVRVLGCMALRDSTDPRALDILEDLMGKDVSSGVFDPAGLTLGESHQPGALAIIKRCLTGSDPDRRRGAVSAVMMNRDASLLEPLLGLALDPERKVRCAVAFALAAYPLESSVTALGQILEDGGEAAFSAALALGRNKSPLTVSKMLSHLSHPEARVRLTLVQQLRRKQLEPEAIVSIQRLLMDPDPKVVEAVKLNFPLEAEQSNAVKNAGH